MSYYLCKLIPPRPNFVVEMTDAEKKIMHEHSVYWRTNMEKTGDIIMYGPVADPQGHWGIGIVQMGSPQEVEDFANNDPAIKSGIGFQFEYYHMPSLKLPSFITANIEATKEQKSESTLPL